VIVQDVHEISRQTEELLNNEVVNRMSNITKQFNNALGPDFTMHSGRRSMSVETLRVNPVVPKINPSNFVHTTVMVSPNHNVSPNLTPPITPTTRSPKNHLTTLSPLGVKALAQSRLSSNTLPVSPVLAGQLGDRMSADRIGTERTDRLNDSEQTKTPTTLMKIAPWSGKVTASGKVINAAATAGGGGGGAVSAAGSGITGTDQLNPSDSEIPQKPKFTPPTETEFAQAGEGSHLNPKTIVLLAIRVEILKFIFSKLFRFTRQYLLLVRAYFTMHFSNIIIPLILY
jgi:hypothetical protein